MNDEKRRQNLKQIGSVLLAMLVCVSAMAGCSGAKKQEAGNTQAQQTQQTEQATPKPDGKVKEADAKPASKKDTGNKTDPGTVIPVKPEAQQKETAGSDNGKKTAADKTASSENKNNTQKSGGKNS